MSDIHRQIPPGQKHIAAAIASIDLSCRSALFFGALHADDDDDLAACAQGVKEVLQLGHTQAMAHLDYALAALASPIELEPPPDLTKWANLLTS
jgi:hypothetical protein